MKESVYTSTRHINVERLRTRIILYGNNKPSILAQEGQPVSRLYSTKVVGDTMSFSRISSSAEDT